MKIGTALKKLSNDELLRRLSALVQDSRRGEAALIAHIAEVDDRRLYAREATSSMFGYCTERLHLSEGEAFLRIQVARAARKYPMLLDMLADGRLHLTGIGKLVPRLTPDNRDELLKRATHRSKREIEELVAELRPRPDVPTSVRKLPTRPAPQPHPDEVEAIDGHPPRACDPVETTERCPDEVARPAAARHARSAPIQPLAPARYKVQFTASAELREKLTRLLGLMRPSVPDGDLGAIIEQLVTEKLERLEAKRFGKTSSPRKTLTKTDTKAASRYIPAPIRRAVHERDGGRCTFVDERGRRCRARDWLEYHHEDPYGRGGDHRPGNVRLLCKPHNARRAERDYGNEWMNQFRRERLATRSSAAGP